MGKQRKNKINLNNLLISLMKSCRWLKKEDGPIGRPFLGGLQKCIRWSEKIAKHAHFRTTKKFFWKVPKKFLNIWRYTIVYHSQNYPPSGTFQDFPQTSLYAVNCTFFFMVAPKSSLSLSLSRSTSRPPHGGFTIFLMTRE